MDRTQLIFLKKFPLWEGSKAPKSNPGGGFFDKLLEITDFGLLLQSQNKAGQDSEFAKF